MALLLYDYLDSQNDSKHIRMCFSYQLAVGR
jgi:hypothetical protein